MIFDKTGASYRASPGIDLYIWQGHIKRRYSPAWEVGGGSGGKQGQRGWREAKVQGRQTRKFGPSLLNADAVNGFRVWQNVLI